ncbi:MAG: hypothetical protein EPO26_17865 [Chloroflexota bacterium]|nr:MAG: hypothetical protein EPO26_17865 [Chloroflexota bacterium]
MVTVMPSGSEGAARTPIVYLDNSAFGRLTDSAPRVLPETHAVARIVAACLAGRLRLLLSEILIVELAAAPMEVRDRVTRILDQGVACVRLAATRSTALRLEALGFRTNDALHLAAAYTGGADFAVSCDRQHWIRRAPRVASVLGTRPVIVTPEECLQWAGLV